MNETVDAHKETLGFQTEVKQLLHLMVHALYSNKEIFLRELISNASDACDKLRFEALGDDALYEDDSSLKVQVEFDKDAKTITIRDNGIGMSREEVIENVGTIAKSGTKKFFNALTGDEAKDSALIGQFGVGFYSAFIVAKKVTLNTRRSGMGEEHGVKWVSEGEGDYTIETIDKPARGTEIVLDLRDDADEFLESYRLKNIITQYSDHISIPIEMRADAPPAADDEDADSDSQQEVITEFEPVNQASALWKRSKSEISAEEYSEFYKHVCHDYEEPVAHIHTHVEGNQSYTSLFYIPARAPFDLWDREKRKGIKLYAKRVFIMDDAEHLMPDYLRFVRGLVDSDDLPLNVSREILQRNALIDKIRGASVKKVLGLLENLAKNKPEEYATIWKEFGQVLKEGPGEDFSNKERVAKLLRFATTHSDTEAQDVSLEDYIGRMKEGQDKIYYIAAETFAGAKNSPHLEVFRKKGIEVLLFSDRVDEWMMSHLTEFDSKAFVSVAKGDLDLGSLDDSEEKEAQEKASKEAEDIVSKLKTILADKVNDVRITHRLTNSPSCLVVAEDEMAANLQRMLKSAGHDVPENKPIMELNPEHPLVTQLKVETDEAKITDWANLLFDQALLAEGGQLQDPASFIARMNEMFVNLKK